MCDNIKLIVFKYYGKYLHLYLITVLTKVIAIVFENFIVFVIAFGPSLLLTNVNILQIDANEC